MGRVKRDYLRGLLATEGDEEMIHIVEKDHEFRRGFDWRTRTDWLIFHHVGPMPDEPVTSEVIHRWHLQRDGGTWNGIGYQAVILPDGTIEEGRPMEAQGAHTRGVNSVSIGVCVVGDFTKTSPTREQVLSSIEFGKWARAKYNPEMRVGGHNTFANTACPGHLFPLDDIRARIKGVDKVEREELSWQQKQAIGEIQRLADMGFLNNPEMHIEAVKDVSDGRKVRDYVLITLISRIAQELRGG